ncbi:hypothetical protein Cus16_1762 [Curtobacterium sp. ER1/6]|nr:hypothetical protein Cus16_1762 [Curtobacterium sp. ER1/6]
MRPSATWTSPARSPHAWCGSPQTGPTRPGPTRPRPTRPRPDATRR